MLFRTSSHTWGRWYLPIFLLRDGLFTLMYIASLISLIRLCSSLPTMVKLSIVVSWPVMVVWSCMGEGCFKCSLNLSPKVLADSPIYSSSHSHPITLVPIDDTTFLSNKISVLGCHQEVLDGFACFEKYLNTISFAYVIDTFPQAFWCMEQLFGFFLFVGKKNIFPYTWKSHVRFTGESLCSEIKLFCFQRSGT